MKTFILKVEEFLSKSVLVEAENINKAIEKSTRCI